MEHNVYLYIAVVALVTYLIRVLPLTLIRREIKNPFLRSFLYYVPYVTLAAMTFPAILHATDSLWSGLAALVAAAHGVRGAGGGGAGGLVQRQPVPGGRVGLRGGFFGGTFAVTGDNDGRTYIPETHDL